MTTTKHNTPNGKPLPFGRRCPEGCDRCAELDNGAAPVRFASQVRAENDRQEDAFRKTNRDAGKCICGKEKGHDVVCTYGDW